MKIVICKDYETMSKGAAAIVIDAVKKNPKAVLGFATGTTPLGLYAEMIRDHVENGTSYKDVKTVNLDEYAGLDITSDQSYIYFMHHNLFDKLDLKPENINIANGKAKDRQAECDRYNKLLAENVQDVQILGIGSNGHIGFNEPYTPFDSVTHVVDLTESTIKDNSRLFKSIDEVPRQAFTMGIANIMASKKIVMVVNGANKAKAVYGMVKGDLDEKVPASILRNHPDFTLFVDEPAAALIK